MAHDKTADINGRLWGLHASDWAAVQEGQFQPVYEEVLYRARVGPGVRHLDVGCGAGLAAALSAAHGAWVSGVDASDAMLRIARERVPEGVFRRADLESLPFADNDFDLVTGFNAFQYASDAARALREAGRVTRPDGTIIIMTWGEPEGMEAAQLVAAVAPLLPAPLPGTPGPFALSADSALRDLATRAGLVPTEVFDVDTPWFYPDEATALRGLGSSGVAVKAREYAGEDAFVETTRAALAPFRNPDGTFRIGARARCLLAVPDIGMDRL